MSIPLCTSRDIQHHACGMSSAMCAPCAAPCVRYARAMRAPCAGAVRAPCAASCVPHVPRHASALCRAMRAPCAAPCVRPVPRHACALCRAVRIETWCQPRSGLLARIAETTQCAQGGARNERAKRASRSAPSQRYEALAKARAVRWLARKLLVSSERVRRRGKSSRCARELVRRDLPSRSPQLVCSSTPVREQPCYALWRSR